MAKSIPKRTVSFCGCPALSVDEAGEPDVAEQPATFMDVRLSTPEPATPNIPTTCPSSPVLSTDAVAATDDELGDEPLPKRQRDDIDARLQGASAAAADAVALLEKSPTFCLAHPLYAKHSRTLHTALVKTFEAVRKVNSCFATAVSAYADFYADFSCHEEVVLEHIEDLESYAASLETAAQEASFRLSTDF